MKGFLDRHFEQEEWLQQEKTFSVSIRVPDLSFNTLKSSINTDIDLDFFFKCMQMCGNLPHTAEQTRLYCTQR